MKKMGYEISEDGRCEWRNNGGIIERRFLYAADPQWEAVQSPCPRTAKELKAFCEAGNFGYSKN